MGGFLSVLQGEERQSCQRRPKCPVAICVQCCLSSWPDGGWELGGSGRCPRKPFEKAVDPRDRALMVPHVLGRVAPSQVPGPAHLLTGHLCAEAAGPELRARSPASTAGQETGPSLGRSGLAPPALLSWRLSLADSCWHLREWRKTGHSQLPVGPRSSVAAPLTMTSTVAATRGLPAPSPRGVHRQLGASSWDPHHNSLPVTAAGSWRPVRSRRPRTVDVWVATC